MGSSSFITFGILDIIDILLVAFLFYRLYKMAKGTTAMTIFYGISILYLIWLLVRMLKMELTSTILGQIMGVGILALIIVFQQEIRRFLLYMGSQYMSHRKFSIKRFLARNEAQATYTMLGEVVEGCVQMSRTKTGALIAITRENNLQEYIETGTPIDGNINSRLIQNIFFKNSPLHDGAAIISKERIQAAQCILPVSDNPNISPRLGLRHRAAIGLTESTDALVIVVSEETGLISLAEGGRIREGFNQDELRETLKKKLVEKV